MRLTEQTCPLCGAPGGLSLGLDKRGRPFSRCWGCGTQAFLKTAQAVGGMLLLSETIRDGAGGPLEEWLLKARSRGEEFMRQVTAAAAAAPKRVVEEKEVTR